MLKSFIKKFKRVTPYKNKNLSFDDRFKNSEKKGWQWKQDFEKWRDDKPGFINYLKWFTKGYAFSKIEVWREDLINLINLFSLNEFSNKDFDKLTQEIIQKRGNHIKNVRRNERNDLWVTLKNNKKYHFVKLKKLYPDIEKFLPELPTQTRYRQCHYLSHKLGMQYYKEGIEADVVTGEVNKISPKYKFLHSWIEINDEGNLIVIEPTMNIAMRKESFEMLFKPTELERIDSKTLYNDQDIYFDLLSIDTAYSKVYLCSRQEAVEKWKEFGLDKLSYDEELRFREENRYKLMKQKINQGLNKNNSNHEYSQK